MTIPHSRTVLTVLAVVALGVLTAASANAAMVAYNDVVVDRNQGNPIANVTRYNIGNGSPGPSSGLLTDFVTGTSTGITATLTQVGGVVWQPGDVGTDYSTAGAETNSGTDAYTTFTAVGILVKGVVYYGSAGWYVDLVFTGLDPAKSYEFVTTANRNGSSSYLDRISTYTISDALAYTNTSSSGGAGASTTFITGNNTVNGYVARWTGIRSGTDGDFSVRATNGNPSVNKGYAFSVFKLSEIPEPSSFMVLAMGLLPLVLRRRRK